MTTPDGSAETDVWFPHDEGQLSADDTLEDRGLDDALDEGYSPPENYRGSTAFGVTAEEAGIGESLDQRIVQEVPEQATPWESPLLPTDLDEDALSREADEFLDADEVGDLRAGRLVAPDQGLGPDEEADSIGNDVGIDGGGASAEEAAMHIVEFP
ncbi:DUF5709 domain-containing protein [Micromonospora sp. NBC_01699]|uniref:DUF5709 domain-containing protein n=1 Tax=Micromonospora sp. NBC_01699 TaxID=2975984 RepID=UPI002E35ED38|nr:DUF5709 domain-containing protein [Micromonospora sp. NBC_01699]